MTVRGSPAPDLHARCCKVSHQYHSLGAEEDAEAGRAPALPGSRCGQWRPGDWAVPLLAAQAMSPSTGKVREQTGRVSSEHLQPRCVWAGGQAASQGPHCPFGERASGNSVRDIPAPQLLPGPGHPCSLLSGPVGTVNGLWGLSGRLGSTKLKGWQLRMWLGKLLWANT